MGADERMVEIPLRDMLELLHDSHRQIGPVGLVLSAVTALYALEQSEGGGDAAMVHSREYEAMAKFMHYLSEKLVTDSEWIVVRRVLDSLLGAKT